MSAELSAIITQLKKEAVSVAASGRANARHVADELHQRFVSFGQQPDFMALQLGLVHVVEHGLEQLEAHDESLVDDLDEDREKLEERNDATDDLTDKLTSVQSACDGVYGVKASLKLFSRTETLPRDPVVLLKLGKRVHRRLADPDYAFPEPKLKGWKLDERETLTTDLGGSVDRLDLALAALTDERKSSDSSRFVKTGSVDEFRRTVRYVAGCLAALYGLAGFDELAAKIRPKRRRRRATGGDGDEAGDAGAETPATDSPEDGDDATPEPPTEPTLVVS